MLLGEATQGKPGTGPRAEDAGQMGFLLARQMGQLQ